MANFDPRIISLFQSSYIPEPNSGCWLWVGYSPNGRYGGIHTNKTTILAHRVSWELHNGEVPDGMCVCHKCDVGFCVNPSHLFVGSIQDNMLDMRRKRRWAIRNPELWRTPYRSMPSTKGGWKLTPEQRQYVLNSPLSARKLAIAMGFSRETIDLVRRTGR